jgi:hypothetical protein
MIVVEHPCGGSESSQEVQEEAKVEPGAHIEE